MEEQLERMLEEPLEMSEVSQFLWHHQQLQTGVELLSGRGELGRAKEVCEWVISRGH